LAVQKLMRVDWLDSMPSVDSLAAYNRFILAFWMTNQGPVDDAQAWQQFSASYRKSVLEQYHDAGIALMVSAFGSTDSPTSNGADPTKTAQKLAQFVKDYDLDGVDVDYEDMTAMNSNKAEKWLITFQTELRRQLPSPYIISHAPVAPWFTSANDYASGAYVKIHQAVGDTIDFYNVQVSFPFTD
jgi:chitinase